MVAAAVIGGAALSAGVGAISASNASSDQQQAAQSAQAIQQQEFNTVQNETAPQRALGVGATGLLANLYGVPSGSAGQPATGSGVGSQANMAATAIGGAGVGGAATGAGGVNPNYSSFYNSPGYQFTVQQSDQALSRQAAAGGNLYSTNTLANLGNLNSGLASTQYNNYVNQLMTAAGLGNAATSTSAGAGTNMANQSGAAAIYGGNAAANGAIGQGQAINNGLGGLMGPNSGFMPNSSGTGAFQPYGVYGADAGGAASGNLTYAQQVSAGF